MDSRTSSMFERFEKRLEKCLILATASIVGRADNTLRLVTVSWASFVRGYLDGFVENMCPRDRTEFIKATGPWTPGKYNDSKEVLGMKTVSQRQKDHDERTRRENVAAQELKERMIGYIEYIGEIEPHEGDEKRQKIAQRARDRVRDGRSAIIGTACDHCETALVDFEPGSCTLDAYMRFFSVCPKCGWNDYIWDFNRQPF